MATLPYLDLTAPGFSTRGAEVLAARDQHWCARTPFGFAVLRHRQAGLILRDRRFRQGSHDWPDKVGLTGSFADFWKRSVISMEGEPHKLQRRAVQEALSEDHIESLCPRFEEIAEGLVQAFPAEMDFVEAFTEPFAGRAIAALLGLPEVEAQQLARDASTLGLAMGLDARSHMTKVNAATDRLMQLADALLDHGPAQGFAARLASAAKRLGITDRQVLKDLMVICIFGGVDTTRAQLAFAICLFVEAPEMWQRLRDEPALVPQALDEVIRTRPTTTWATRQAVEDLTFEGVGMRSGDILHLLVHATGTDPATGHDGAFDPFSRRKRHFGFGGGAHHCLGQFVAKTDMACAMRVLLRRVERFEFTGAPKFLPDSGNTSPQKVPLRLIRGLMDWSQSMSQT